LNKPGAYLQAFAGHLIDLYWLNTFHFANPHSYSKLRIINAVRKKTGARMMIESGTYRGVTAARCARLFEKVYTIELDKDLAAVGTEYLRG
jgi:predicted O-methyltransferase YrrM